MEESRDDRGRDLKLYKVFCIEERYSGIYEEVKMEILVCYLVFRIELFNNDRN